MAEHRKTKNVVAGSAATIGIIGTFGPTTLRMFGYADAAVDMASWVRVITLADVQISWFAIYMWMAVIGFLSLIAVNFDIISRLARRYRDRNNRKWDISACEALDYIAAESILRADIGDEVNVRKNAEKALVEAAQKGIIRAHARRKDSALAGRIGRRVWKNCSFDATKCDRKKGVGAYLIRRSGEKVTIYLSILFDEAEIKRVWPKKRYKGPRSWMAQ